MRTKEYGKLTHDQFDRIVRELPEIRGQMKELPELVRSNRERLAEILGPDDHSWGEIYGSPFLEQLAALCVILGLHKPILEVAKTDDPQEEVLNWLMKDGVLDQWYDANQKIIDKKHLVWLLVVLQRNILSIMLYHKSMGALVEEVRKGDEESFFKAIRIDKTVLLCQTFADRLSRAELSGDKDFFIRLRSAIKGPTKKHMAAIQDLRYSIAILRGMGFEDFSDNQLERLFIHTRLYPNSASALKNLRKHIQDSRKISTI